VVEAESWAVQFISIPIPVAVPRTPFVDIVVRQILLQTSLDSFGGCRNSIVAVTKKAPLTVRRPETYHLIVVYLTRAVHTRVVSAKKFAVSRVAISRAASSIFGSGIR